MKYRTLFWVCILFLLPLVVFVPNVAATFTYGNWSWDGTNKILTIVANASNSEGDTEAHAYGFQNIVNCGLADGYYNVSASGTQFEFNFRIVIGDGSTTTWFVDTRKQITFNDAVLTATWQIFFEVEDHAYVTFGTLENENSKTTSQGISFVDLETSYNHYLFYQSSGTSYQVHFYSCHIVASRYTIISCRGNVRFWNTILTENTLISDQTGSNIFNTIIIKGAYYGVTYPRGTYDKFSIYETTYTMLLTFTANMSNLYARRNDYIFRANNLDADVYLINVDSDTWATYWSGTSTGEIYRQYNFDLTITYPNGTTINGTATGARATIQHYGQGGAVDYNQTLGEDGTISTQILSMGFYNQTGGDTIYSYNPYNLQVTNITDYDDYSMNFTLSDETDWTIILNPTSVSVTYTSAILVAVAFLVIPLCVVMFIVWRKQ